MTKVLLKAFSKASLDMIHKLVALHSSIQIIKLFRKMKNLYLKNILTITCILAAQALMAGNPDPKNYFGVTVANGMIGLVSSPELAFFWAKTWTDSKQKTAKMPIFFG